MAAIFFDDRKTALSQFNRLAAFVAALLLLAACDRAVRAHVDVAYRVEGNPQSALYPVEVRQDNEDVLIRLKNSAPAPEVTSIDPAGHEAAFNFAADGDRLLVPAKFDHLRLRYQGDTVDILRKEAAK